MLGLLLLVETAPWQVLSTASKAKVKHMVLMSNLREMSYLFARLQ